MGTVVDTSAWVEWLIGGPIGKRVQRLLPPREAWIVPTIIQLELAKWLLRETDEERTDEVIAFTQKCIVVPLDTRLALRAVDLHREHGLATADAVVYATALENDAALLTCDAHFEGLPHVTYVPKKG